MPKTLLLNYIMTDGIGDYHHYQDIEKALSLNPNIDRDDLFSIICLETYDKIDEKYTQIEIKLTNLSSGYFFGCKPEIEDYIANPNTQKLLGNIEHVIIISCDCKGYLSGKVKPYLKKGIPIKCIFEHERKTVEYGFQFPLKETSSSLFSTFFCRTEKEHAIEHPVLIRSLGLSPGTYGLKLQSLPSLNPSEAWDVIAHNDSKFAEKLLACGQSNSFNQFIENHELFPAYVNYPNTLGTFMRFLDRQSTYFQNKNIIIFLSGMKPERLFEEHFQKYFKGINRKIELHDMKTNDIRTLNQVNEDQKIIIVTGAYLSEASFHAFYDLSKMACVTGDTSLELALSKGKLPFYHSTNHLLGKSLTIEALNKIAERQELGFTTTQRQSF